MTAISYLRKTACSALQFLQTHPTYANESLRIICRNESSFVPKRVLIVAKLSRYHFEKLRAPELNEAQLKLKLLEGGSDYDTMIASHLATKTIRDQVIRTLCKMNVEYKIVNRTNLEQSHFTWADLILPIGGDGTFLLAANLIFNNKKPIMGINSYPEKSEGHLMLPAKYTQKIPEIFEMLRAGHYSILMRSRIRTTMKGEGIWKAPFHMHEKGLTSDYERFYITKEFQNYKQNGLPKERRLPWLALNEVFVGEALSARTSSLLLKIDEEQMYHKVKSSGLCVSTGTGSTSWFRSINSISCQTMQEVLNLIDTERKFSNSDIEKICSKFNNSLQFDPEDLQLSYSIRDMIRNNSVSVPRYMYPRGLCKKVTVKSLCFDAGLVLDGGIVVPFDMGTTMEIEVFLEDSLRTISFPE